MTDDRPGGASPRPQLPARLLIAVGALAIVGGAIVIVITKTVGDNAPYAESSTTAYLAVGVSSGYLFPAAGPDYGGVWIGLAAVVVGIAALTIGLIGAYRRRRTA